MQLLKLKTLNIFAYLNRQSRDSQMLIRGGANYSYEQINNELVNFTTKYFNVSSQSFKLAVCGLRIHSEHEDECCVMIEPLTFELQDKLPQIENLFLEEAKTAVSKGARPNYMRLGSIPMVQSKGIVSIPDLIKDWKAYFATK